MNGKVTYRQQYTRCGKQRCRKCKEGAGHGPYWYAYWSENGRTISKYIGIHAPAEVETRQQELVSAPKKAGMRARQSDTMRASLQTTSAQNGTPEIITISAAVAETQENRIRILPEVGHSQSLLRIYLLGQFRVERKEGDEWQTVANRTWQRRRARALLGCLLSQAGRRMGREQVMEALWPDLDIETAANRLNGAVHELRQILEPGIERPASSKLLRLERDILILADASHIWVDAEAFEALLNKANTLDDPEQSEKLLENAWTLYEGDYLLEELYSEWATARRESLRRGWMGLLLKLAELRAQRDALISAIEPLDRLLTADPTHETAVRRLMVLLTQLDRRGEAIRVYERLATILRRDYENDPLPETAELYKTLRQRQSQAAPSSHTPLPEASQSHSKTEAQETVKSPSPERDGENNDEIALDQQTIGPLVAWHPLARSTFPPRRHGQSPLIGREHELEAMRQILQTIDNMPNQANSGASLKIGPADHRPQPTHFVMVMGETGIGKTRVAEEITQEAHTLGWRVAWTRAYEQEGTIPYRPWTDILRTLLQDVPLDELISMVQGKTSQVAEEASGALSPAAAAQARLARLSALLPEIVTSQALHLQQNSLSSSTSPEQERFHLWETVLTLLNALSQSTPLLLVLDDLHWTDDSSLELLAYLARHQQNGRIMLIGTCRDRELAPSASLRALLNDLRREGVLATFLLQPLTHAQIALLLAHLPREFVGSIQSQASGNPLFAEELARFSEATQSEKATQSSISKDNQPAEGSEKRTTSRGRGNHSTALPETIAAVLERRLHKLSAECQTLLSKAAVLGGSFEFSLLIHLTGETSGNEDRTLDLLEEALRSGLLTEEVTGTRIMYHFWHPLIVSHLYENLSAARRAQLHRRTAQALIELHADNEAKGAAAIAHHLDKYGQDKQKLAHYAEMAANQSMTLSAYPEALHYYRQVLEALQSLQSGTPGMEQDPMHLANLLEYMAECNLVQGNHAEARQLYARVLELHANQHKEASQFASTEEFLVWQQEEAQVQGMIWRAIGHTWKYPGEYSRAHECAEWGKQVLRVAGITTGAAWACLQHLDGSAYWAEGNFTEAMLHLEEALAIQEELTHTAQTHAVDKQPSPGTLLPSLMTSTRRSLLGDPLELSAAHESLGIVTASLGQYNRALQHVHTALAILEEHNLVSMMSRVCGNLGAVYAMKAEHTIASTYFKRALEVAERTSDIPTKVFVTGNLGDTAARSGNLQEAATWLTDSLVLAEQMSDREYTCWALVALATVQQDLGKMREALENIRRALAIGRSMKSTIRIGLALVALANWRVTRALMLRNQQAASQARSAHKNTRSAEHQCLLQAARAASERALALEDIEVETRCAGQLILTTIAYQMGDLEHTQQQAMKVLDETRQSEMIHLAGRAHCLLGEIQFASKLPHAAHASFAEALQIFKQYDMPLDYARTLQRYGHSLLELCRDGQTGIKSIMSDGASLYSTALDYLREARALFETCQAIIDLQAVEVILADPSLLSTRF